MKLKGCFIGFGFIILVSGCASSDGGSTGVKIDAQSNQSHAVSGGSMTGVSIGNVGTGTGGKGGETKQDIKTDTDLKIPAN